MPFSSKYLLVSLALGRGGMEQMDFSDTARSKESALIAVAVSWPPLVPKPSGA